MFFKLNQILTFNSEIEIYFIKLYNIRYDKIKFNYDKFTYW